MRMSHLASAVAIAAVAMGTTMPVAAVAPGADRTAGSVLAPTATTATLSGRVLDANRRPVVGATVEVFTPRGEFVNDIRTSLTGRFSLSGLALGSYRLRARPSSTRPWATTWAPSAAAFSNAGTVYVRSFGGRTTITLPRGGVLAGRVTSLPARATVRACSTTFNFLDCRTVIMRRGQFRIPNLPAGMVNVVVLLVTGRSLVFPAQPPRPGVPIVAGRTTTIVLDAARQTAPVIVS